jgi:hypothetical protein
VKYFRPGLQFECATFDDLASQNPKPLSLGERAVDQSDILPENDGDHIRISRLGVESTAGWLADYRDLQIQGGFAAGRTRWTRAQLAPAGPVPIAKLTDVAVPAMVPKNGLGGKGSQQRGDRRNPPAPFLFDSYQQRFLH